MHRDSSIKRATVHRRAVTIVFLTISAVGCTGDRTPVAPMTYTVQLSPVSVVLVAPPGSPASIVVSASVTQVTTVVSQPAIRWSIDALAMLARIRLAHGDGAGAIALLRDCYGAPLDAMGPYVTAASSIT